MARRVCRVSAKKLAAAVRKEKREHPWTTLTQARKIARDHLCNTGFGSVTSVTRMKGLGPGASTFVASSSHGRYRIYKTWEGKWAVVFRSRTTDASGNIRDEKGAREWSSKIRAVKAMRDHDSWLTRHF